MFGISLKSRFYFDKEEEGQGFRSDRDGTVNRKIPIKMSSSPKGSPPTGTRFNISLPIPQQF